MRIYGARQTQRSALLFYGSWLVSFHASFGQFRSFFFFILFISRHFVPKKGKKIIFIFLITFGRVYSFSLSAVFVFFGFAFLFTVACSVELRSYGGLARRGTLSTFVPGASSQRNGRSGLRLRGNNYLRW